MKCLFVEEGACDVNEGDGRYHLACLREAGLAGDENRMWRVTVMVEPVDGNGWAWEERAPTVAATLEGAISKATETVAELVRRRVGADGVLDSAGLR